MSNEIQVGDTYRLSVEIKDAIADTLTDPANLSVIVKQPSGSTDTYVYNTDSEVVRDATGKYHVDYTWSEAGQHKWGSRITGIPGAVEAKTVHVSPDPLA